MTKPQAARLRIEEDAVSDGESAVGFAAGGSSLSGGIGATATLYSAVRRSRTVACAHDAI